MRIVVKVGTSTLAHPGGRLNIRHTEDLVKVWSDIKNAGHELIVVSSAATGLGVGKLQIQKPRDITTKQAAAAVGQCELMYRYDKLFSEYGHTVAQVLVTGEDARDEVRSANIEATLNRLLALGALPIVNENDTVSTAEIAVGDNDTLGAIVAVHLKADLLVLPTHADDEHLWFGGALPWYAGEKGYAVQVAYMTNHWGEPYRPHELLNGLWTVGVRNYPIISDFPDLYASKESLESARQVYDEEAVTAWQVEQLRRFKPSVVLGHDVDGEYGHGAHMLNAATLLAALECSGDAASYPESAETYGVWQVPKCYLHLWPENTIQMEWGEMPMAAFDGRTALELAAEGFACHVSQTQWFEVKAGGSNDCRKFGLAYTNVGPDEAKNDFFEHIPSALPAD